MLKAIRASKVDLVLLAVAAVWGASYLSAKAITPYASVPAMLSVRFAIATLAMVAIWLIRRRAFSKTWKRSEPACSFYNLFRFKN
jgi:drug/metabolite transporter (DMT)-like permease